MDNNRNIPPRNNQGGPNNQKKNKIISVVVTLIVALIFTSLMSYMFDSATKKEITYNQFIDLLDQGQVEKVTFDANKIYIVPKTDGTPLIRTTFWTTKLDDPDLITDLKDKYAGVSFKAEASSASSSILYMLLEWVLPLVFFWAMLMFIMRKTTGGKGGGGVFGVGKSNAKIYIQKETGVTFKDVAGQEEAKESVVEMVDFLHNPGKYTAIGAKLPKGALLVGPPGTGKTLLAKAVAGEAKVPFFSLSGSDFVEMFVGVGASRVRDLFKQAEENAPCIVFIDEIDAVGRQRGAGLGGGHDEREQTLNQLLVEMDGFGANEGIIMIAATNRPDILDPALMRPGRFDRQVMVGYPDVKGREAILKVHARGKPLAPNVDLATIAKSTAGFTGADLENLLNEAALLAARKHLKAITMDEIEEATIKVVVGAEKKSHVMTDKEKTLTAYHEAGHAIAAYSCKTQDPVHQISIIPRGRAGGYTMQLPSEDRSYKSRSEMLESLVVLLGGRVAEALVLGDISTGASNDIERATQTVRAMITKYGMTDELGPITYGSDNSEPFLGRDMGHVRDYSEETASEIDAVLRKMISNAYHQTEQVLKDHMSKLHEVAKQLFLNEKMSGEEFYAIMEGPSPAEVPQEAGTTTENSVSENTEEKTEE